MKPGGYSRHRTKPGRALREAHRHQQHVPQAARFARRLTDKLWGGGKLRARLEGRVSVEATRFARDSQKKC